MISIMRTVQNNNYPAYVISVAAGGIREVKEENQKIAMVCLTHVKDYRKFREIFLKSILYLLDFDNS